MNSDALEGVTILKGDKPGNTVALFGGVHGNERVGVEAVREFARNGSIEAGTLYLVEANPPAIASGVRATEKNLNRNFYSGNTGEGWEASRARDLMQILDKCDALLDIHASNTPESPPFLIGNEMNLELMMQFTAPIVSYGWDAIEPGAADGYMSDRKKIGLCVECGYAKDWAEQLPLAQETIRRFLAELELLNYKFQKPSAKPKLVRVHTRVIRQTDALRFKKAYLDFEKLPPKEVFLVDGEQQYTAGTDDCIIFCRPNAKVGAEACVLGTFE